MGDAYEDSPRYTTCNTGLWFLGVSGILMQTHLEHEVCSNGQPMPGAIQRETSGAFDIPDQHEAQDFKNSEEVLFVIGEEEAFDSGVVLVGVGQLKWFAGLSYDSSNETDSILQQ